MPPRRRTFYLADATLLSNPKIIRLRRDHPDDWLSAVGAFHVLIGVATLNESPKLSQGDIEDVLGPEWNPSVALLRAAGLLVSGGIESKTFAEWAPKARPKYPSDSRPRPNRKKRSKGTSDSTVTEPDSAVVGSDSVDFGGVPTTNTTTTSKGNGIDSRDDVAAFVEVKGHKPSPKQRQLLDEVLGRHDVTGAAWSAAIIRANPDDPIGAVIREDKAWKAERQAQADRDESAWVKTKRQEETAAQRFSREYKAWVAAGTNQEPAA